MGGLAHILGCLWDALLSTRCHGPSICGGAVAHSMLASLRKASAMVVVKWMCLFRGVPKVMGHRTLQLSLVVIPMAPAAQCVPLSSPRCFSKSQIIDCLETGKNAIIQIFSLSPAFLVLLVGTLYWRDFQCKIPVCWDWSSLRCFLFLSHQRSYSRGMWKMKENALINKVLDTLETGSFRLTTYGTK